MLDLYALVDLKNRELLSPLNKIPESWMNISGLIYIDRDKIGDLGWLGYENRGWISLNDPTLSDYKFTDEWFYVSKSNIKTIIKKQRQEKLKEVLYFNGNKIELTPNVTSSIYLRLSFLSSLSHLDDIKTSWKFIDGFVDLSKDEFADLAYFISNYIQSCFDKEKTIIDSIDACDSLLELSNLSFNYSWPSVKN